MRAKTYFIILLVFLLGTPLASSVSIAETKVGGPISKDVTWILRRSPYIVISHTEINKGVTLKIEPGVLVKFNGKFFLEVSGTLIARGTSSKPIAFTSNKRDPKPGDWEYIKYSDSSKDATFDQNRGEYKDGCILEYCHIEYGGSKNYAPIYCDKATPFITHSKISNNLGGAIEAHGSDFMMISHNKINRNDSRKGAIYADKSKSMVVKNNTITNNSSTGIQVCYSDSITITHNKIKNNISPRHGGGITVRGCNSLAITYNVITNNSARGEGGGIYCHNCSATIANNEIVSNSGRHTGGGMLIWGGGKKVITQNIIKGNVKDGIYISSGGLRIDNCNIYNNHRYDVYNQSRSQIEAVNNWWGTTDRINILHRIYDHWDDNHKGKVSFEPFLKAPATKAGMSDQNYAKALAAISSAQDAINKAKTYGISIREATKLLLLAKTGLEKAKYKEVAKLAFRAKQIAEQAFEPRLKEEARTAISSAQKAINEIERRGIDVTEAKEWLRQAETLLINNKYTKTKDTALKARHSAEHSKENYEKALAVISKSHTLIDEIKRRGVDVTEGIRLLDEAQDLLRKKNYQDAMKLALNAEKNAKTSEENYQEAFKVISSAQSEINGLKGLPIMVLRLFHNSQVRKYERFLQDAQAALKLGNYSVAMELGSEANKRAKQLNKAYEMLVRQILVSFVIFAFIIFITAIVFIIYAKRPSRYYATSDGYKKKRSNSKVRLLQPMYISMMGFLNGVLRLFVPLLVFIKITLLAPIYVIMIFGKRLLALIKTRYKKEREI